ncbi:MAG: hypothetical protein M3217_13105 [Actinomycetota bacterium]|nr:hypothetical protein [Actinomycetota bacterium]
MRATASLRWAGTRVALCAALIGGGLFTGAAAAAPSCETVWVRSYHVSLDVGRDTYRIGDIVRVEARVTRNDTGTPVAGAKFVAIVPYREALVLAVEKTDAAGRAVAELELKRRYVSPGPARLIGIAYNEVADTTCATVVEYGKKTLRRAFVVRR